MSDPDIASAPSDTVTPKLPPVNRRRTRRLDIPDENVDVVLRTLRRTKRIHEVRARIGKVERNLSLVRVDRSIVRGMIMTEHPEYSQAEIRNAVQAWLTAHEERELHKFRSPRE